VIGLKDYVDDFVNWFGWSVEIDDCDPAIYMINYIFDRLEFNLEQKYWLVWIYGTTYEFPTTWVIWNEFPDFKLVGSERLSDWNKTNYKRLRYQNDTKWNKGFLPEQYKSYKKWVGKSNQIDRFSKLITKDSHTNFDVLWNEIKSNWFKFGRYSTWFYLQTLKHCVGVNVEPRSLLLEDYDGSRSHRNGLLRAVGMSDLIDKKPTKDQVISLNQQSESILKETKKKFPKLSGKIDYYSMETALCSFKKLFRERDGRYLGYYLDRQAQEIIKAEQDGWIGINWQLVWQSRKESIKKQYLNNSIDKQKMKLFLNRNLIDFNRDFT
jgi:hypothetical protein